MLNFSILAIWPSFLRKFKMWEVKKGLVVKLLVSVPIASPADLNPHLGRDAQDKPSETIKCFTVVPSAVRGFWEPGYDVGRPGRLEIVGAVGVFKFGAAFVECLVLLLLLPAPTKYGAIPVLDYFVKKEL